MTSVVNHTTFIQFLAENVLWKDIFMYIYIMFITLNHQNNNMCNKINVAFLYVVVPGCVSLRDRVWLISYMMLRLTLWLCPKTKWTANVGSIPNAKAVPKGKIPSFSCCDEDNHIMHFNKNNSI